MNRIEISQRAPYSAVRLQEVAPLFQWAIISPFGIQAAINGIDGVSPEKQIKFAGTSAK